MPVRLLAAETFDLAPAVPWFPLVGGAVGATAGGVLAGLEPVVGRGPGTVLSIAVVVLVTGALHQDGLADTADGLGVRGDRARRLAAMRDSSVGTFGVLAVVVWALVLLTVLDELSAARALRTLVAGEAVARLAAVAHAGLLGPARADGLGAVLTVSRSRAGAATVVAAGIAALAVGPTRAALSLGVGSVVAGASCIAARRSIGGRTGDTIGATISVAEAAVCLALAASWR